LLTQSGEDHVESPELYWHLIGDPAAFFYEGRNCSTAGNYFDDACENARRRLNLG
jgi:hypothetical protein